MSSPKIQIAQPALFIALEADLYATFDGWQLKQEGKADIWLDMLPQFAGPQDIKGSQIEGIQSAMQELLLAVKEEYPNARVVVTATGDATIYAR